MGRREVLLGAAALVPAAAGCRCASAPSGAPDPFVAPPSDAAPPGKWRELSFEPSAGYPEPERALVSIPDGALELPLVVALHGRGETRSLDIGARGFRDYYGVDRIDARLRAPPITADDLLGFTTDERLAKINASLAAHPYRGVVLACPYAPDLADRSVQGAVPFGRFILNDLVGDAWKAAGAKVPFENLRVGIDGVSMGGRLALWVGFRFAEFFGAIGAMQPALRVEEAPRVAELAAAARATNPGLRIRLLSSEGDPFLAAVRAASEKMTEAGVSHDLVIVPGPHDYEFNRGPGCAEMLLWQERALRSLPSP